MAFNVNPWRETIVLDKCRVCPKAFCCKRDRDLHEEKTHGRIAPCVKSLPEICQNCNVFVSNINDIQSDCVKITNSSLGVLNEYSPNIITDRPRKRTFSAMSAPKQQQAPELQEDSSIIKRTKKQARKRNRQSGKISSSELAVAKKDSNEISPKFEEVKSSSTPIKLDRQDLRKILLKSKIEAPATHNLTVNAGFKSPPLHSSRRNSTFNSRTSGASQETSDADKSVYGTPGYASLTPFGKGKRSYGRASDGSSHDVSVYGTPKSSFSFDGSPTNANVTKYDEDICMSSVQDKQESCSEKENLNITNVSNSAEAGGKLIKTGCLVKENLSEVSFQVESKMISRTVSNVEMNEEASMTPQIKLNDKLLLRSYSINSAIKQLERAKSFAEFELELASPNSQEYTVERDCRTLPCSRLNTESAEIMPSNSGSDNIEDMCAQPVQQCIEFVQTFKKTVKPSDQPCQASEHASDIKISADKLNFSSGKGTSLPTSVCQETPSNSSHKRMRKDFIPTPNEGSTPDSITGEIVKHQLSSSLYFKPISHSNDDHLDSQFEKKVSTTFSMISNEAIINASGFQKCNPAAFATESIIESHFQSLVENKENLVTTEPFSNKDDSHYKSMETDADLFQKDQVHVYQANITPNSTSHANNSHLHTVISTVHRSSTLHSTAQLTSKDPKVLWSDSSVEWKSFTIDSSNSQETSVQNSRHVEVNSSAVLESSKNPDQSCMPEDFNSTQNSRDHSKGRLFDGGADVIGKSPEQNTPMSVEKSNLSAGGNLPFDSLIRAEVTRVNLELQADRTQKFNVEDAPYSGLEDTLFKMVAYHSTPMVRPLNRTSASLDDASLDCTRSRQDISSLSVSSKKGFFGQAKKRIKSYFPYFFNSKNSKSTEDLPSSSSLQVHSLSVSDATVSDASRIQSSHQNDSESQPQGILKRRPIWSWPKRRRPIHENRVRVRDDSFEDTLDSE